MCCCIITSVLAVNADSWKLYYYALSPLCCLPNPGASLRGTLSGTGWCSVKCRHYLETTCVLPCLAPRLWQRQSSTSAAVHSAPWSVCWEFGSVCVWMPRVVKWHWRKTVKFKSLWKRKGPWIASVPVQNDDNNKSILLYDSVEKIHITLTLTEFFYEKGNTMHRESW